MTKPFSVLHELFIQIELCFDEPPAGRIIHKTIASVQKKAKKFLIASYQKILSSAENLSTQYMNIFYFLRVAKKTISSGNTYTEVNESENHSVHGSRTCLLVAQICRRSFRLWVSVFASELEARLTRVMSAYFTKWILTSHTSSRKQKKFLLIIWQTVLVVGRYLLSWVT